MREVKFRAWREWERRMIYDEVSSCISFDDNGVVNQCSAVAMQFTGMQDCNHRDIYEGDIIKEPFGARQIVKWDGGGFRIGSNMMTSDLVRFRYEVMGNVFENPELLPQ